MSTEERRAAGPDRRAIPRGGRRAVDRPGRFPTVLVADSSDAARIPCVKYLNLLGFAVDQAVSGSEALAKIEMAAPHVVVVESGLPNAPISQIVGELNKTAAAIPVIVMTSDLGALEHGAAALPHVAVLEKPFSLSMMVEEIRRLLRGQKLTPAHLPVCSA